MKVYFSILSFLFQMIVSQNPSPCPDVFRYEKRRPNEFDRWYGTIDIKTAEDFKELQLNIILDRRADLLGILAAIFVRGDKVPTSNDNMNITVEKSNYLFKANSTTPIGFFVKYNAARRVPSLKAIRLNGKTICMSNISETEITPISKSKVTYRPGDIGATEDYPEIESIDSLHDDDDDLFEDEDEGNFVRPYEDCGIVPSRANPLIVNGRETTPAQWPWHVALYYVTDTQRNYKCGGSLITEQHVLTAAHCVTTLNAKAVNRSDILILLGKYDLKIYEEESQNITISNIFVHPRFKYKVYNNDIAILRLSRPADITDFVRPICLWEEETNLGSVTGKQGIVVGWGYDKNGNLAEKLKEILIPIVSTEECLYSDRDFFAQFKSKTNYCAGYLNGTSVCNGDSGGGMVYPKTGSTKQNPVWQIRGIVSIGASSRGYSTCDPTKYSFFTDVAKYTSWILRKVRNTKQSSAKRTTISGVLRVTTEKAASLVTSKRPISNSSSSTSEDNTWTSTCGVVSANNTAAKGQNNSSGQWPWYAALYYSKGIQLHYTGAATLISDRHLLTAAHCVTIQDSNKQYDPSNILVYLGKYNLQSFGPEVQDTFVSRVIVHPEYNNVTRFNDIAVLELYKPVLITNYVSPCCLWDDRNDDDIVGKHGVVVGWGFDKNRKPLNKLKQASVPIVSTDKCIHSNKTFFSKYKFEKNYCAGVDNGTLVCHGYSGDGMVFPKKGMSGHNTVWQIRGIVSIGVELQRKGICDTSGYTVFTDVAKYMDWVQQILLENNTAIVPR